MEVNTSYSRVTFSTNSSFDHFHVTLWGEESIFITQKKLDLETDEKRVHPNLWKHLPEVTNCKTSKQALDILKKIDNENDRGEFSVRVDYEEKSLDEIIEECESTVKWDNFSEKVSNCANSVKSVFGQNCSIM